MLRIAILALLCFLPGCRREASPVVFVDPALEVLVPPDTTALAGVRMGQLAKTPFYERWVQQGRVTMFEEFRRRTGIDPARDIWELLVANDGKTSVALVRGRFSEQGREPQLPIEGARRFAYKGYTLIGSDEAAVIFFNPTTAAAGPVNALYGIVDRREDVTGIPTPLRDRLRRIPSTNQAWFVASVAGRVPDISGRNAGMLGALARFADSIEYAFGGIDVRQAFRASATLECEDEKQAEELRGALRALLGMGRLSTGEDRRELLSVFDAMQLTRESSLVKFSTDIPFDLLEKSAAPFLTPRGK